MTEQTRDEVNRYAQLGPIGRALATLVRDFLDPDPCRLDDQDDCRAHGWRCPRSRAREVLAATSTATPAIARPDRWLHIAFTSPDEATANTSALAIRDHLAAEFDGVSMRITTNATEAEPDPFSYEERERTGRNAGLTCPAATEATDVGNKPDAPAWTPPPPGDRREQLPDAILTLLDIPPYTSTACESAELCAAAAARHPEHADELRYWEDRQRQRCRINNKYTGVNCEHAKTEPAAPAGRNLEFGRGECKPD